MFFKPKSKQQQKPFSPPRIVCPEGTNGPWWPWPTSPGAPLSPPAHGPKSPISAQPGIISPCLNHTMGVPVSSSATKCPCVAMGLVGLDQNMQADLLTRPQTCLITVMSLYDPPPGHHLQSVQLTSLDVVGWGLGQLGSCPADLVLQGAVTPCWSLTN